MYLSELNPVESKNFLELVYKIANTDVNYAGEEIRLLKKFKGELDLDVIPSGSTIENLIAFFAAKSDRVKKIVLFEAAGMVYADEKVTENEAKVLDKMVAAFGLDDEEAGKIIEASKNLEAAYMAAKAAVQ